MLNLIEMAMDYGSEAGASRVSARVGFKGEGGRYNRHKGFGCSAGVLMTYSSTKTYGHEVGLSCAFRQCRATHFHCRYLHGYAFSIHLEFETEELMLPHLKMLPSASNAYVTIHSSIPGGCG